MDAFNHAYVSKHFEGGGAYLQAYEDGLCCRIFERLMACYPGYDWKVRVDARGGMASVKLPRLHRSTLGYNFPIAMLDTDPGLLVVVRAGGEMLERWNLRRGKAAKSEYTDVLRKTGRIFTLKDEVPGGLAERKIIL